MIKDYMLILNCKKESDMRYCIPLDEEQNEAKNKKRFRNAVYMVDRINKAMGWSCDDWYVYMLEGYADGYVIAIEVTYGELLELAGYIDYTKEVFNYE